MDHLELQRTEALVKIKLGENDQAKRFLDHMSHIANNQRTLSLSAKQKTYLEFLCWKYRGQLAAAGLAQVVPTKSPYEPGWTTKSGVRMS